MRDLPHELYTPEQVGEIDRRVIDSGVAGIDLMQRAGLAAYRLLRRRWPQARRLCVICGGGNNGGDGYIIARRAAQDGLAVDVRALVQPERLKADARLAAEAWQAVGAVREFTADAPPAADMVVDALLGTGLDRPVEGRFADAIDAVNAAGRPVLAVDVPSGIHGDTGAVMGTAVRAAATITFIGLKRGLLTGQAPAFSGELTYARLQAEAAAFEGIGPAARRITADDVASWLPPRGRAAHKGRYGHVAVVGGDHGTGGAVRLAAEAAGRAGAGLVSAATRAEHVGALLSARPEIMVRAVDAAADLDPVLERAGVLVLGPGLGQEAWGRGLLERCLRFEGPLVLDADALNLLAKAPRQRDDWVLTPHPGEAGRLAELAATAVQADRFSAVEALQARFGGVCVLKGAGTLIRGDGATWLCDRGNPGLATGGTGDVLSGVIGGLLAQGLTPEQAAAAGVWLHASAGDLAAADGERGLLAADLMPHLRRLANPGSVFP